ncbi:MAG: carboxypeptidase regulatory-like domain-containing protein [Massilia sp.]
MYVVEAPVALPDVAMLTGADGTFRLSLPAPGVYRIGVSADGYARQTATVVAAPGPPIALWVTLQPEPHG